MNKILRNIKYFIDKNTLPKDFFGNPIREGDTVLYVDQDKYGIALRTTQVVYDPKSGNLTTQIDFAGSLEDTILLHITKNNGSWYREDIEGKLLLPNSWALYINPKTRKLDVGKVEPIYVHGSSALAIDGNKIIPSECWGLR